MANKMQEKKQFKYIATSCPFYKSYQKQLKDIYEIITNNKNL